MVAVRIPGPASKAAGRGLHRGPAGWAGGRIGEERDRDGPLRRPVAATHEAFPWPRAWRASPDRGGRPHHGKETAPVEHRPVPAADWCRPSPQVSRRSSADKTPRSASRNRKSSRETPGEAQECARSTGKPRGALVGAEVRRSAQPSEVAAMRWMPVALGSAPVPTAAAWGHRGFRPKSAIRSVRPAWSGSAAWPCRTAGSAATCPRRPTPCAPRARP
jgi:hypothetical protein